MRFRLSIFALALLTVSACEGDREATSATPSLSPLPTPAATLAPITVAAEPGRDVALPVHTGKGSAKLPVVPFRGPFELQVSCVGGGSIQTAIGDANRRTMCDGAATGYDIATRISATGLDIGAAPHQHWRVAVMTGHTRVG